jgi:hypothetical protein
VVIAEQMVRLGCSALIGPSTARQSTNTNGGAQRVSA